jgi:peptidylprolyl isomerase
MTNAQPGNVVELHCVTKEPDGTVIESTAEVGALHTTLGVGALPAPVEEALVGMSPGERKTIHVAALAARRNELVHRVRTKELPETVRPEVGETLEVVYADGRAREGRITDVNDHVVTVDANHPLAGRALVLDIEVLSVT